VITLDIVNEGDKVQLVCELKLEDGTSCLKYEEDKPLVVTVGKRNIFPSVEKNYGYEGGRD
jgi:FKBP-type peptidyl-prolyl cis-trans isomerase 2